MSRKHNIGRRDFFRSGAALTVAAAGIAAGPALGTGGKVLGASDRLRVGVIGPGRMGRGRHDGVCRQ